MVHPTNRKQVTTPSFCGLTLLTLLISLIAGDTKWDEPHRSMGHAFSGIAGSHLPIMSTCNLSLGSIIYSGACSTNWGLAEPWKRGKVACFLGVTTGGSGVASQETNWQFRTAMAHKISCPDTRWWNLQPNIWLFAPKMTWKGNIHIPHMENLSIWVWWNSLKWKPKWQ